jgi:hypothetical protein
MFAILATEEAEIRRITVQGWANNFRDTISKKALTKKG